MVARFDVFYRAEGRRFSRENVSYLQVDAPENATVLEVLRIARSAGLPKGSARAGAFEVQGPRGVWTTVKSRKIDLSTDKRAANLVFATWDAMEEADADADEIGVPVEDRGTWDAPEVHKIPGSTVTFTDVGRFMVVDGEVMTKVDARAYWREIRDNG